MKKILLLFLFTSAIYSQNVNVQDYEVPISQAKAFRFNGNWNWAEMEDSVTSNFANANFIYSTFYSSLPLAWFIDLDATGYKNMNSLGHNILFKGRFNKYIWPTENVFGFSELNASHNNTAKQIGSDLTVGFGYGRYIDATPLAKAVRIEDHLLKDKVISDYLPKETMIAIANIIERESEFKSIYGEVYEPQWFDAIEEEIKKTDQLVEENIGSIGILRMRQVLFNINERVNPRFYGWEVTTGILFPLTTLDNSPPGNPNLSLGGRYSLPLRWTFQVSTNARIFTPMDSSFFKTVTASFGVDLVYELSNKINFITTYNIGAFKPEISDVELMHNLTTSFWFYLENNIYLTINGSLSKTEDTPRIISTTVGLQYNLF